MKGSLLDAYSHSFALNRQLGPGFLALLDHAVAYDTDGEGWPRGLVSDDDKRTRDWHQFLIENLLAGKAALGLDPHA